MITENTIREELKKVIDPEYGFNIVELGFIYSIKLRQNSVQVDFTLTSPGCPYAPLIKYNIIQIVKEHTRIKDIRANFVFEPRWGPEMMSEEVRFTFGFPI